MRRTSVSRLLFCSESDIPSVNMRDSLLSSPGWESLGEEGGDRLYSKGDTVMVSTPDLHIHADDADLRVRSLGFKPDTVVFMSRHAASSGAAALTVHPIGNYHENRFGGRERSLVKASPALMTDALRRMSAYSDLPDFSICFEVTHHGPWLDVPTFFIEIGSDQRNWGNKHAADILAHVLEENDVNDYPTAVGVAGGHYAPRFTEVALGYRVNFGHMLPSYQLEGSDDEDIVRMVADACSASGTKIVYLHRKALKKPQEVRVSELIRSAGFEIVSSSDLDPVSGNPRTSP